MTVPVPSRASPTEDLPLTCVRRLTYDRSHEHFALYRGSCCEQVYVYQFQREAAGDLLQPR
jgi:hypothetical protein